MAQKYRRILILFCCLLLVLAGWGYAYKNNDITFNKQMVDMNIAGATLSLNLEIAATPAQWEQGLMYRRRLDGVDGMLFLFGENDIRYMWMKNTLMPLDMVFFDSTGQVVHIVRGAVPESTDVITSDVPAAMVLELPAGKADAYHIKEGDVIHAPAIFH